MKKIFITILTALSCVLSLLPLGLTANATSAETTEETTLSSPVAEFEEGYWNLPPDWWDEELFLESAVKIIQESDNSYNQAWDGEYEYFALGVGKSASYTDYLDVYVTFYKEEPEFFLKDGDTIGIQTNRAYYISGIYNPNLTTSNYGFMTYGGNLYHANDKDPYELIESYPDGYRIYYYEFEDFTNRIRSTTDITFFSNNVNMYEERRYYQKTNIPNECFSNIGLNPPEAVVDDSVSVNVFFNPSLLGEVDRQFYSNGMSYYSSGFTMSIKNNSNCPIQYRFAIVPEGVTSINIPVHSDYATASDAVYVFMSKEWVYATDTTSETNWYNELPRKQYKATDWHYISKDEQITQHFSWSQIPINSGINYNVIVQAVPIKWDCASQMGVSPMAEVYEELYHFVPSNAQTVYSSTFNIKYLGDVQYNYNDTANGIVPYSSWEDFQRASFSYDAYYDDNGEVIGGSVNLYDDPNSWKNNTSDNTDNRFDSDSIYSSRLNSLSNNISSYLVFLNVCMSYLPPEIWTLISTGFVVIIVIAIIKVVK